MAVPTIYYKLIAHYQTLSKQEQAQISAALKDFRLMVSGSAALPVSVLEQWRTISGHTLLERYGITEMGTLHTSSDLVTTIQSNGEAGQALVRLKGMGIRASLVKRFVGPRRTPP